MAGEAASDRANCYIRRSRKTTKPLEGFGNLFGGIPGWGGLGINVFHDKVCHLVFRGGVVMNLGNTWCVRVTYRLFVDIQLRLVLGEQRAAAIIFNKVLPENYATSETRLQALVSSQSLTISC